MLKRLEKDVILKFLPSPLSSFFPPQQDLYAPNSSALIDPADEISDEIYFEMIKNIFSKLCMNNTNVVRLDVMLPVWSAEWVGARGRNAHVAFLNSCTLIQMMVDCYGDMFLS